MFILSSTLLNSFIPDLPDPFSSTIINSHLETALDKSCNPPDPSWSFFYSSGGRVLRYSVTQSGSCSLINVGKLFSLYTKFLFFSGFKRFHEM
jgi:hypothetical protein